MASDCGQELTKADLLIALLWEAHFHLRCPVGPGKQTVSSMQSQPMPQGQLRKFLVREQPSKRSVHCLDHPLSSRSATKLLSFCSAALQRFPSSKDLPNGRSFWSPDPSSSPAKLQYMKILGFCQFLSFFLTHMLLPPEQDEIGGPGKKTGTEMSGVFVRKVSYVPITICMI